VQFIGGPGVAGEQLLGEPLALRPATSVQQAEDEVGGDEAAHSAFQAEFASALVALLGALKGVVLPTGHRQGVGNRQISFDDGLGIPNLLGDAADLQTQGDRPVGLAEAGEAKCQDAQRLGLLHPGTDHLGDRDCFLAARDGLLGPKRQQQCVGVGDEYAGASGRRRPSLQQPLRLLEGGQSAGLVAGDPAVVAEAG
jgi:hypothetical protein